MVDEKYLEEVLKALDNIAASIDAAKQLVETRRKILREGNNDVYKDGPPMAYSSDVADSLNLENPTVSQPNNDVEVTGLAYKAPEPTEEKLETITPNLGNSLFGTPAAETTESPVVNTNQTEDIFKNLGSVQTPPTPAVEPAPSYGSSLFGTPTTGISTATPAAPPIANTNQTESIFGNLGSVQTPPVAPIEAPSGNPMGGQPVTQTEVMPAAPVVPGIGLFGLSPQGANSDVEDLGPFLNSPPQEDEGAPVKIM